jgi:hypothetical protein
MIPVHFQANYLPNYREFKVVVKFKGKRISEKMSISKFLRLARRTEKPLVIGGITIEFAGDEGEGEKAVRDYLKAVADSYLAYTNQLN